MRLDDFLWVIPFAWFCAAGDAVGVAARHTVKIHFGEFGRVEAWVSIVGEEVDVGESAIGEDSQELYDALKDVVEES